MCLCGVISDRVVPTSRKGRPYTPSTKAAPNCDETLAGLLRRAAAIGAEFAPIEMVTIVCPVQGVSKKCYRKACSPRASRITCSW